jgi:hypothetical protein
MKLKEDQKRIEEGDSAKYANYIASMFFYHLEQMKKVEIK